ncbi:MAG: S-layer homology domain-containing protein [Thermostichus sp. BF3_bins_97]
MILPLMGIGIPAFAQANPLVECVQGLMALGIAAEPALEACREQLGSPDKPTEDPQETATVGEFSDISGVFGEAEIRQLTQLGIIEADSEQFRPEDPIERGQFIIWLVRAFNTYYPDRAMRFGSAPDFSDTTADGPYARYLGAAQDAGFVVGFTDGTFRPEETLTREQMIALKSRVDSDHRDDRDASSLRRALQNQFDDVGQFDDQFLPFIVYDHLNAAGRRNFERLYGTTRSYRPKQAVTRAEAAVLLSRFDRGSRVTAAQALQRKAN